MNDRSSDLDDRQFLPLTPEQKERAAINRVELGKHFAEAEEKLETSRQHCPICDRKVMESERYPSYVCTACSARATDSQGRKVRLSNRSLSGGFAANYEDGEVADETQTSHQVFIDGMAFHVDEAHMGGIVITPITKQ